MSLASQDTPQNDLDAAISAASKTQYWLSRFILLRFLGFIYFVAFFCAVKQIIPLVGHDGLLPADDYLRRLGAHFGSNADGFFELPSVFWFGISDGTLLTVSWIGLVLSIVVMCGYANSLIMLALWALYMSIV